MTCDGLAAAKQVKNRWNRANNLLTRNRLNQRKDSPQFFPKQIVRVLASCLIRYQYDRLVQKILFYRCKKRFDQFLHPHTIHNPPEQSCAYFDRLLLWSAADLLADETSHTAAQESLSVKALDCIVHVDAVFAIDPADPSIKDNWLYNV